MTRLEPTGVDLFLSQEPPRGWLTPEIPAVGFPKFSLVFVVDRAGHKLLLGLKKRGFATGILNGFGGKLETGETIEECAIRETAEECGLSIAIGDLNPVGELLILWMSDKSCIIHIYIAEKWEGEPIETEEMDPRWVSLDEIPYPRMQPTATHYLPAILSERAKTEMVVARVDCHDEDDLGWWMGWVPK